MGGYAAIFTLLAVLRDTFALGELAIGAIAGSAFLAGFVAQLSLARFADLGRGHLLMRVGILVSLIGAFWMCFADSLFEWVMARVVLGFGAGAVRPAIRRLAFVLEPSRSGEMMGKLTAWEMMSFLFDRSSLSPIRIRRIALSFYALTGLLLLIMPFVINLTIPGSESPLGNPMRT